MGGLYTIISEGKFTQSTGIKRWTESEKYGKISIRNDIVKSGVAKENNENYLTDEEQHKIIIKDYDMLFEYRE